MNKKCKATVFLTLGLSAAVFLTACAGTSQTEQTGATVQQITVKETESIEKTDEVTDSETITEQETVESTESSAEETETGIAAETETESRTTSPEQAMLLPADTVIEPEEDVDGYFVIREIGEEVFSRIYGNSFPTDGGITTDELRYLRVLHVGYDGQTRIGEMIVSDAAAEDTLAVFRELYDAGYQIRRMVLVDTYYDAEDPEFSHLERGNQADSVSIKHDNTSAFNFRVASNDFSILSNHARGRAIDLNPFENPYVYTDGSVDGPSGCLDYVGRSQASPENHMMTEDDLAVQIFKSHGFSWGGDWVGDKDYQHFDYER